MSIRWEAPLLVVLLAATGCSGGGGGGGGGPQGGEDDFSRAEAVFRACVEEHGAGVNELEIQSGGVARLRFDEGTPPSLYDEVAQECEGRILPMLKDAGDGPPPSDAGDLPPVPSGVGSVADYVAHLESAGFNGAVLTGTLEGPGAGGGVGVADRVHTTPNTIDTVFDVGSVAKIFTAAAVLKAVEQRHLPYDATLGDLLPHVPADKTDITVGQLLTHRSGLQEYHDSEGDFEQMTRKQAKKAILGQDLAFEPGSDSAYSNSGYTLLAMVLERVLGESFIGVVTAMFDQVGMSQTGFYGDGRLKDDQVAVGYEGLSHGSNRPDQWPPTWALLGAGGVASSAADLHRWISGMHSGQLVDPVSVERLYDEVLAETPQMIPGERIVGYAGGNDFGFETTVVELLNSGQHVIVTSNSNPPGDAVSTEAALVLAQLLQSD